MILCVVIGSLDIPAASWERYRALSLNARTFEDWPEGAPVFTGESPGHYQTVGDVWDAAARLSGQPSFVEFDGGRLAGLLDPDATIALHQDLATALRLAEEVGGTGQVAFVVPNESLAFMMNIGEQEHDHVHEDDDEDHHHDAVGWAPASEAFNMSEGVSLTFIQTMEFLRDWSEDKSITRRAYRAEKALLGLLPLEEQPHHQALLTELAAQDPARVLAVMSEKGLLDDAETPLARHFPDAAALRTALTETTPKLRAAAIELLALLSPETALPRVEALLTDPSRQVRRHALRALGHIPKDAALTRLLNATPEGSDGDPIFADVVTNAALNSRAPAAERLIEELLVTPTFAARTWAGLDRVRDADRRSALAEQASQRLALVSRRLGQRISSQLLLLHDRHPAEEVRLAAAQALVHSRGPEAETRTEDILCTLNGMGRALNGDEARRKKLLHVEDREYENGLLRIDNIDHPTLQTLVDERFANPDLSQNDAPSIAAFLELMTEHPELRAGGYLIPPARSDYRVSLDSLACPDLNAVPKDRRAAVKALFEEIGGTATSSEASGDTLRCSWT
jgi:HEAT repeat protein